MHTARTQHPWDREDKVDELTPVKKSPKFGTVGDDGDGSAESLIALEDRAGEDGGPPRGPIPAG